jgi:methyl-accepting chemotaxis protein
MSLFNFKTDEEKYQLQAINDNYAVISFKPDGTILHANKNFADALGYDSEREFIGKHHGIFCDAGYVKSREYTDFWNSLNSGKTMTSEFKRIRKDGSSIFIQASYMPICDSNGRVIQVIKYAQDVTQRKLQTLDYEGQLDAIGKSQAVIEFNMDGTIIKANENFLKTLGYSLSEIVGKHHSMFCEDTYKLSTEYKDFWKRLNNGQFDSGEYSRIGKGGKHIWIQASYNPIMDIDNKPCKVVKYATDITEKKNLIFDIDKKVQGLTGSLDSLSSAAVSMSKGAQVTMNSSHEVSVASEQINQAVSDLSEKIEAMLSSITKIADSSAKGEQVAKEAQLQSKETTKAMMQLNEESTKIGETIHIITQIAFQTNILSLNAAVEAATAGEAGKGLQ